MHIKLVFASTRRGVARHNILFKQAFLRGNNFCEFLSASFLK